MISIKKILILSLCSVMVFSFFYQVDTAKADPDDESSVTEEPFLLKLGSEGDDVIMLQLRLKDLGYYNYKITNYFGSFTESALKDFQKVNTYLTCHVVSTYSFISVGIAIS